MTAFNIHEVVDVVVLHRSGTTIANDVLNGILGQQGVECRLFGVVGESKPSDFNRWWTIARARNRAHLLGKSPWLMFVDDDVVLDRQCIRRLLDAMHSDNKLMAVAANYDSPTQPVARQGHVSMGATLFRRSVLSQIPFRATEQWCECWCMCRDIRARSLRIEYCPTARAFHRAPRNNSIDSLPKALNDTGSRNHILAAFDRRDIQRFETQFLRTLRCSQNNVMVHAIVYGLYPTEIKRLQHLPGVHIHPKQFDGQMVPIRRVADFGKLIETFSSSDRVAYWDTADVIFQDRLSELWKLVSAYPEKILAVAEPRGYPHNGVIIPWTQSIYDPRARRDALNMLKRNPFLNSGFAAGTAKSMSAYFQEASQYRNQTTMRGTSDWGDQLGLNIYCHRDPHRWRSIDPRWNYCTHDRRPKEISVRPDGKIISRAGHVISVAHGNARSLRQFALSALT